MLEWDEIARRFDVATHWWVSSGGPAGPHAVPVWGVVVDGVLYFYGDATTVRSRNLALDPRVVVHLDDPADVLILHGRARDVGVAEERPEIVTAYAAKYPAPEDREWLPGSPELAGVRLWVVEPERAIAWVSTSSAEWVTRRWAAAR